MANTAEDVLNVERGQIGYYRFNDPEQGTRYGRWFVGVTGNSYYGANGVPFCAMFQSWCFAQAGVKAAGLPGAYCPTMLQAARNAGKVLSNKHDAQPGDLVYFDWDGGVVDHIGIVERNCGGYLQTIEGNTNGGRVARRTRAWGSVAAIVRPDYCGASQAPAPAPAPAKVDLGDLHWWGPAFTREMQRQRNTPVDGIVSGQGAWNRRYVHNTDTNSWRFNETGGSTLIRSIQRMTGAGVDGYFGHESVTKLQQWLIAKGYSCGASGADGYMGPDTCVAIGRALQDGAFRG